MSNKLSKLGLYLNSNNINMRALAKELEVNYNTFWAYTKVNKKLPSTVALKIIEKYGCELNEIA